MASDAPSEMPITEVDKRFCSVMSVYQTDAITVGVTMNEKPKRILIRSGKRAMICLTFTLKPSPDCDVSVTGSKVTPHVEIPDKGPSAHVIGYTSLTSSYWRSIRGEPHIPEPGTGCHTAQMTGSPGDLIN